MADPARPSPSTLTFALVVSILAVSTAATLLRLSEAGPMAKAFHRLLFATLLLAGWGLLARPRGFRSFSRRDAGWMALAGLMLALHFATWIASLDYTSVAASLLLVTSHPLLVALASQFRGDRITRAGRIGLAIAFAGAAIIFRSDSDAGLASGANPPLGNALAFAGAVAIAGYFLIARHVRQRVDLLPYATATYGAASFALLAAVLVAGEPLSGYSLRDYGIFLALAVVPMLFGHTILNWAIRWLPAPVVAATVLGEPVGGTALAFLVLHEVPGATVLLGGLLILSGILLVARSQPQ